jgi:putative aldouronate transport system substrate-binding protein
VWAYTKPAEFDDIGNKLDEIAWPKLISCVIGKEENFDKTYDEMLKELEDAGMSKAEKILTDIVKEKVKLVE